MTQHFYRFRSVHALLDGYHELENQEIYFASPSELNDPMEGLLNVFWQGDRIAWKNLLRHYLKCLTRACALWCVYGEEHPLEWGQIPILDPSLPTEDPMPAMLLDKQIDVEFFSRDADEFIDALAARTTPVRRDELRSYIQALHPLAVTTIFSCYERAGLTQASVVKPELHEALKGSFVKAKELVDAAKAALTLPDRSEDALAAIFAAVSNSNSQLALINRYNGDVDPTPRNKFFVFFAFSDEYVDRLEKLLYPEWYTACFMSDCRNSSLWAHYGANHSGVCLQFKAPINSGRPSLALERLNSISMDGPHRGIATHEFMPVEYTGVHVGVDFFRSLGRLPIPVLNKNWYFNEMGERSICAADLFDKEEVWRKGYWNAFKGGVTTKLKDWEREQEHRLILHSQIIDFSDRMTRKAKYNFDSLDGIIFGMKTPMDKKVEMCKIIEAKCRAAKRADFKFYQAYFSPSQGTIEHAEMRLLKFAIS